MLFTFKANALIIGGIAGGNWLVGDDPSELQDAETLPLEEPSLSGPEDSAEVEETEAE